MPLPILLANRLTMELTKVRKTDKRTPLMPDGKSQVTVEYESVLYFLSSSPSTDCRSEDTSCSVVFMFIFCLCKNNILKSFKRKLKIFNIFE